MLSLVTRCDLNSIGYATTETNATLNDAKTPRGVKSQAEQKGAPPAI